MTSGSVLPLPITGKADDAQQLADPAERLRAIQEKAKKRGLVGLTPEERAFLTADSVRIPAPGNNAIGLPADDDRIVSEFVLEVRVTEIDPYDRNPRKSRYEKFDDLKESIRLQNLQHVPPLTRRPGSKRWTLAAGGNTRIQIVQELWEETRDSRFEKYIFPIKPWGGEGKALLAHIIENDQRADLCFWDKAHALEDLQKQIALERGAPSLSLREFETALTESGFRVNRTTLGCCRFVVSRLGPLVGCASRISGTAVQTILQPRLNSLGQLLAKADLDPDSAYTRVLSPAMQAYVDTLSDPQGFVAEALCQHLTASAAAALGKSTGDVERMITLLSNAPDASLEELAQSLAVRPPRTSATTNKAAFGLGDVERDTASDSPSPVAPASDAIPKDNTPTQDPTGLAHRDSYHPDKATSSSPQFDRQADRQALQAPARLEPQTPEVARNTLTEAQQAVADLARQFASHFGAGQMFRPDAATPSGYSMECPEAAIGDNNTAMAVWWLVQCSRQSAPALDMGQPDADASTPVLWAFSPSNTAIETFLGLLRACHTLYCL
jgi:ParB family protein of integrating conjugative element (PFGI_1 class)